ncbi:Hypothetical predicted protein [Mytilus galloprovincialis]|uniref:Reverse transcriptase domain-containing protein n=1 Tax=Mytilus galloprovincialis TaxID=29158 RepID=A0A8B6BLX9_MYTGA|nr:Hypothetical predicted protein [Mytilus galloprovincialis]
MLQRIKQSPSAVLILLLNRIGHLVLIIYKIAHEKERTLRKVWVIDGRPRGMHYDSYKLYKRAKHEFRNIQQAAYEQYIQQTNDDINKAAACDIRLFWKLIKRNKAVSSKIYPEIIQDDNICNTPESIANAFMDYFSKLYQPDSDEMYDNDTRQQIELDYNKILKCCYEQNVYLPGGIIKESEVDGIIKLLKRRKASGHDKIQHEHLLYGGHTLVRCLTSLFNLVVSKGRIPNGWKLGLLVPLFKGNNKPKTSPDSYRPITLLPCVLKVFEHVIKSRLLLYVFDGSVFPNPQQQGFQKYLGCLTASFNLHENYIS